jgi:predicted site-specific integrase-resolvase
LIYLFSGLRKAISSQPCLSNTQSKSVIRLSVIIVICTEGEYQVKQKKKKKLALLELYKGNTILKIKMTQSKRCSKVKKKILYEYFENIQISINFVSNCAL